MNLRLKTLDYRITLRRLDVSTEAYEATLKVGEDDFATVTGPDKIGVLARICDYVMSTEGRPTDSLEEL